MNTLGEWADEHWDVLTIAAALALAVAVSGALGVAYSVAAARLDPSAPPAIEAIAQPRAPAIDPAPAHLIPPSSSQVAHNLQAPQNGPDARRRPLAARKVLPVR